MISRCHNENDAGYKDYGARGVIVCERWRNSFEAFLSDMGERPSPDLQIDRFPDNDGNYEPGNCRWATLIEQNNNKRNNRHVEFRGEKITIPNLARKFDVPYGPLYARIRDGWDIEVACTTPFRKNKKNRVQETA